MGGHRREGCRGDEMTMTPLHRIDDLKVDARNHRDRRDLYRAKIRLQAQC
jgi:hypothetical protein